MKKLLLALTISVMSPIWSYAGINLIDKIVPKNGAFQGLVDSSQTIVSTAAFSGNLSSSDTDVQKALETLDQLSVAGGGIVVPSTFTWPSVEISTLTVSSATVTDITINGTCTGSGCSSVSTNSTYTWTGAQTFTSSVTFSSTATFNNLQTLTFENLSVLTLDEAYFDASTSSMTVSTLTVSGSLRVTNVGAVTWSTGTSVYFQGGVFFNSVDVATTPYTATDYDYLLRVDATEANITVNLPAASGYSGKPYIIKKVDSSANTVSVSADTGEYLDGHASVTLISQYDAVTIQGNGTGWDITGNLGHLYF